MTETLPADRTQEIVAEFADRPGFERAVAALLADGFERTDLSVLATHDSLEVAGDVAGYHRDPQASFGAGLASQLSWLAPLGIAGALLIAAGPVGAAVTAVLAAAAGAVALRPALDQLTESAHAEGFAAALDAGHILLWVRTIDAAAVARATDALLGAGGHSLNRLASPMHETPLP